ncbi:MAG: TlpA disulfide reductase family protein [Phycisphaerales bacterium]
MILLSQRTNRLQSVHRMLMLVILIGLLGASQSRAQETQSPNAILEASANALAEIPGFRAQFQMGGDGGSMFKDTMPSMNGQLFFGTNPDYGRVLHLIGEAKDQQSAPSKPIDVLIASDRYLWTDTASRTIFEKPAIDNTRGVLSAIPLVLMQSIVQEDPFAKYTDNAQNIDLLASEMIQGVLCDVIHIKKNPPKGRTGRSGKDSYTDARWYIGAEDKLPRKVEHITDAGLMKITLFFDLSNFSITEPAADMLDVTRPDGFAFKSSMPKPKDPSAQIDDQAPPPTTGNPNPITTTQPPATPRAAYAPTFSMTPAGSTTAITNSTQANRITVLYFTGSWCIPCKEFTPMVSDLADEHADDDVDVIAIAIREADPEQAVDTYARAHRQLPIVIDDQGLASRFKARVLPSVIVVDRDGLIVFQRSISKDVDAHGLIEQVKEAITQINTDS